MPQNDIQRLEKKLNALRNKPDKGVSGKKKVDALNDLAYAFRKSSPKKTEDYACKALAIARKLDYRKGQARCSLLLGVSFWIRGKYNEAMANYHIALEIYEELGDIEGIANSYHSIGIILGMRSDYQQALDSLIKALHFREKFGDKNSIALSYNAIGVIRGMQGDYAQALIDYQKALKASEEIGDTKGMANPCNNIAIIYQRQGDYTQSMEYVCKSLRIFEDIGDIKGIAGSYSMIGIINDMQRNYDLALEYYFKALKIQKEMKDKNAIANSYTNIGITYEKQGTRAESLKYHLRALKIREEIGEKEGVAASCNHLGVIYENQGSNAEALRCQRKALKLQNAIGDMGGIVRSHNHIGNIYTKLGDYASAFNHLSQSLQIAKQVGTKDGQIESYHNLSALFEAQKAFGQALDYYKKYTDLEKQVYNAKKSKQITQMRTKYETEKKKKEAEIYQLKNVALRKEIRQRKKAEEELKEHRDKLEQLVAERTAQLRSLAHELSLVEEKQRRQIASYLHDEINQALALATFKIESLQDISSTKSVDEELSNIKEILDQTAQRVRSLTFEISPPILYELGLTPAVEWLLEQFGEQYNIRCRFKDDGLPKPMTDDARILLFQSVRELLNNISKHADAQSVTVSTLRDGNLLRIAVEDDGVGFDPKVLDQKVSRNEGFGLFNLKERLRHVRGQLHVKSEKGEGTSVVLITPLRHTRRTTRRIQK